MTVGDLQREREGDRDETKAGCQLYLKFSNAAATLPLGNDSAAVSHVAQNGCSHRDKS